MIKTQLLFLVLSISATTAILPADSSGMAGAGSSFSGQPAWLGAALAGLGGGASGEKTWLEQFLVLACPSGATPEQFFSQLRIASFLGLKSGALTEVYGFFAQQGVADALFRKWKSNPSDLVSLRQAGERKHGLALWHMYHLEGEIKEYAIDCLCKLLSTDYAKYTYDSCGTYRLFIDLYKEPAFLEQRVHRAQVQKHIINVIQYDSAPASDELLRLNEFCEYWHSSGSIDCVNRSVFGSNTTLLLELISSGVLLPDARIAFEKKIDEDTGGKRDKRRKVALPPAPPVCHDVLPVAVVASPRVVTPACIAVKPSGGVVAKKPMTKKPLRVVRSVYSGAKLPLVMVPIAGNRVQKGQKNVDPVLVVEVDSYGCARVNPHAWQEWKAEQLFKKGLCKK